MSEQILIIDFGSQYTQLIARRVRELNVYCEIHPYNCLPEKADNLRGIILAGSPCSVREKDAPNVDLEDYRGKVPILGICYGAQLMVHQPCWSKVVPVTISSMISAVILTSMVPLR